MGALEDDLDYGLRLERRALEFSWFFDWVLQRWTHHPLESMASKAIAALGLSGEAGEVGDQVKKDLRELSKPAGAKSMNRDALCLELGDTLHYWCVLVHIYGFTPEEVIRANRAKLIARDGGS